jgi:two-component system, NarL family, sensor histidine kinase DesK
MKSWGFNPGAPPGLPPAVETALAFVLLEGVTNVVRHAQARHCRVEFGLSGGVLTLVIRDSRQPADLLPVPCAPDLPQAVQSALRLPAEGHGIAGMRQRLAAVGGTLAIELAPEGGTLVARVPLPGGSGRQAAA